MKQKPQSNQQRSHRRTVEPIGNHLPSLLAGLGILVVMVLGV